MGRKLKPQIVKVLNSGIFEAKGLRVNIFLDRNTLRFFAQLSSRYDEIEGATAEEVEIQIIKQAQTEITLNWRKEIWIETYRSTFDICRLEVADHPDPNRAVVREWEDEVPANLRTAWLAGGATSTRHVYSNSTFRVPYSDEAWIILRDLISRPRKLEDRLLKLLESEDFQVRILKASSSTDLVPLT